MKQEKIEIMEIEVRSRITKVKVKKVKIELPYYTKSNCHWYKIIDEKTVIQVCFMSHMTEHNHISFTNINQALEENKTTENEFLKAYNKVLNQIHKHI